MRQLSQLPQLPARDGFAEIAEQAAAAAARGLGQPYQRVELADRYALEGIGAGGFVDHAALLHDVGQAIGHPGAGGLAVAAGAAGFLVIGLDALRQIEMRDEAHVGLVDAHAERDGGDDHDAVLVDEAILVAGALPAIEARMIGQCRDAGLGQRSRGILDLGARQAIDDAGIACMALADEGLELRRRVLLVDDLIADVRAVEARDKARRIGQPQPLGDLLAREVVGGGGQRDARHIGKTLRDHGQADIFGAEIMPPLRHAMRLVDGKQRDFGATEQREAARRQQPLGRDVEQVEIAGQQPLLDRVGFLIRQRRVQHRRLDAGLEQARDLVAHQRDQRRDHDAAALAQ